LKLLQICSKLPYPPKDGGSVAMNILTEGLISSGNEVHVLAINTPKHFIADQDIDLSYRKRTHYRSVLIDTDVKPFKALMNLFSSESYNISRFYSLDFENVLVEILKKNDFQIVQLETLWVVPYLDVIRKHSKGRIVLRSHNVEYSLWERLARTESNPLKKAYLNLLAKRLKKYELSMLNRYDAVLPITESDLRSFEDSGCKLPMMHVPFGIDSARYRTELQLAVFPRLFHIGAMDWMPNQDGIRWFLESAWPKVHALDQKAELHLAGRNMPDWLKQLKKQNVFIAGEVPDSISFINSASVMIVPLRSGGGMRVKIIEGMALGKAIISTSIGAEGIAYTDGENILIADTADEFVTAISRCCSDKTYTEKLGLNARKLIEEKYDNKIITEKLSAFYHKLIRQ
jgi:glycosyltransferase involved in cell wall biosynthesis